MKFHEWNDSTTSRTQDEEFEIHQILFGGKPLEMHGKNAFPFEVGRSLKKTHQEQVADMCGLGKKKKTTTFVRIGKKTRLTFCLICEIVLVVWIFQILRQQQTLFLRSHLFPKTIQDSNQIGHCLWVGVQEKRPINAVIIYSINDKNMNQDRTSPWISPRLS